MLEALVTDLSHYTRGKKSFSDKTIAQGPSSNINKEEGFFNRTTRYYKYLENKDINYFLRLISKPESMKDPTLAFIHNTSLEMGLEVFDIIPTMSLNTRNLINNYFIDAITIEVKAFKDLEKGIQRGYLHATCTFLTYFQSSRKKPDLRGAYSGGKFKGAAPSVGIQDNQSNKGKRRRHKRQREH